jgi:hypothetical protein
MTQQLQRLMKWHREGLYALELWPVINMFDRKRSTWLATAELVAHDLCAV